MEYLDQWRLIIINKIIKNANRNLLLKIYIIINFVN